MRHVFALMLAVVCSSVALADRSLLLVTPNGVWKSEVTASGPGPWIAQNDVDVIVQGFGPGGGDTPPVPDPPNVDTTTSKVAEISKTTLKDKAEATACAALVSSLVKTGLPAEKLKEAMELAAPILDAQLKSGDRITRWAKEVTAITTDAKKMTDGLRIAWNVELSTVDRVAAAAMRGRDEAIEAEALDWAVLIQVIQMIIELLKSLGVI